MGWAAKTISLVMTALVASVGSSPASANPSPGKRLTGYLWNYRNELLRPYVTGVQVTGGHIAALDGKSRLTDTTANVRSSLRGQPSLARAARAICLAARSGVQTLHLRMISAVRVWSVDGHTVARC
jgi:hypothetical protein